MKKLTDYLKPNILIIFGALLLVYFLNYLSLKGAGLALGIVAVILAAYYIVVGILHVIMGNKLSDTLQKTFGLISVALFAIFMFITFLLTTIEAADFMGPTAWVIKILSMVAALALVIVYIMSKVSNVPLLERFTYLFSLIFVLALLLDLLFTVGGDSRMLGQIDVLLVAIYGAYSFYLFSSIGKTEDAAK